MSTQDLLFVIQWWVVFFFIGIIFLPLTRLLLKKSSDSFYVFSRILGIALISYTSFILSLLKIVPFSTVSLLGLTLLYGLINLVLLRKKFKLKDFKFTKIIVFEELLFLTALIFWAYIRAHEPSIHSLEKYMDFGFLNSALRTTYFPPKDMWFSPFTINYYYFGHIATAVLTKLSGLSSSITYNLMLATIFAFTVTGTFSLLFNVLEKLGSKRAFMGGLLGGFLLALGGNLHTIYAFFAQYPNDHPASFYTLKFLPFSYPNNYWYPNATRFIPFTIHEFPLYSFVVSDLHGHVIDIPFVLLTLALVFAILKQKMATMFQVGMFSLLLAIMYMTNAWDGLIYLTLACFLFFILQVHKLELTKEAKSFFPKIKHIKEFLIDYGFQIGVVAFLFILFVLPFSLHFKPFISGVGVLCAPTFLTNIGKIGPFLFEANHCQKSPLYQLFILYGFFYLFVASFLFVLLKKFLSKKKHALKAKTNSLLTSYNPYHVFILLLILLSTLLVIVPEFFYAKDIYPQHYRANTMFKLVYEAYIMFSISSAYIIVFIISSATRFKKYLYVLITIVLLTLIFIYPYFAIKSYYGDLKEYKGLNGTSYLSTIHPGDLEAISYLNKNVSGQPVILEAQGDSYTDYGRISANTGLPTVLGWTVHEWLWRGSYDIPAPRIEEVKKFYEENAKTVAPLIGTYNISYVVVGDLEREKYPKINEGKFSNLGKVVFVSRDNKTKIYKINEGFLK